MIREALNNKTIKKDLNNKIDNKNKKIINKKYDTVKSKVGLLLKGQNKNVEEANKTKSDLNIQKTALKSQKVESKISLATTKKSLSVPIKERRQEGVKNNNILNKVKKFKAESSLKKMFSENPLLKTNKSKLEDKTKSKPEESAAEKSEEQVVVIENNNDEDVVMSVEKTELLNESAQKSQSGSKVLGFIHCYLLIFLIAKY